MENILPSQVPETNNFRRDHNKMLEMLRRMQLQTSSDILISQTTHGTSLMVSDKIKKKIGGGGLNWAGVYNETGSYSVNDLVFVDFHGTYSVPFTVPSGSAFPAMTAGIFLCVAAVPSVGSRNSYNYYYPICPTIPSSSVVTVSGSVANQTFWQPINPLLSMSVCLGGQSTQTYWIGAFPSNTFNMAQLPYSASGF